MVVEKSKSEKEIAKSTGNDLDRYADSLEDEADQLINQMYHPDKAEEEEKKKQEEEDTKKAEQEKQDETKNKEEDETAKKEAEQEEAERLEAEKKEEEAEILEAEEDEDFESFKKKAEKRIKDNQAQVTRKSQEAAQYKKELDATTMLVKTLQQTVDSLQVQLKTTSKSDRKGEEEPEKKAESIDLDDINKQIQEINKIDSDLAKPIENVINKLVSKIDTLNTKLINKTKSDEENKLKDLENLHYSIIEETHPDWATINESHEFQQWISELPPREKRLALLDLDEGKAEDIVELLSDYKKTTGLIKDDGNNIQNDNTKKVEKLEKARQLSNPSFNRSKTINTGEKVKYTRSQLQKMSPEEYEEHESDIDKEMAAGRIGMY